jgi:O-antigen ligase
VPISLALAVVAVVVAMMIPFWGTIQARVQHADPRSAQSRVTLTKLAAKMIRAHPLLGVGVNNVPSNISSYAGPEFDGQWLYAVHDKYLLVWAEAGIGALLAFVWFLLATFRRGFRVAVARDRLLSPIALGLTAGLIGEAVHMFVDVFESRAAVQSEWLVAAILAAMAAIVTRQRSAQR